MAITGMCLTSLVSNTLSFGVNIQYVLEDNVCSPKSKFLYILWQTELVFLYIYLLIYYLPDDPFLGDGY